MPELTIERLQLFLLVVMPGIIAIKVHDLFYPPEKRDFGSSLLEALAYGLINLAIWAWPILKINQRSFAEEYPIWYAVLSFCFLVVSPTGLALAFIWLRNRPRVAAWIGFPNRTAWDDYFKRRQECWILFHLKNGKMVGGYFGAKSYASTFPQEPEVYVEAVFRVDPDGRFVEKVEGTLGMVVRLADCERLEFLAVEEGEPDGQEREARAVRQARRQEGRQPSGGGQAQGPEDHKRLVPDQESEAAPGRLGHGAAPEQQSEQQPGKVNPATEGEGHG